MSKKIFIIVPHDDDLVLSFGGLLSKARNKDLVQVHICCMGGPCSNVNLDTRLSELRDVKEYFKIDSMSVDERQLDGILDTLPNCEITGLIDDTIQEFKPDEVYCGANSEHSDHQALYSAFLGACRLKTGFMPKLFAVGTYPFSDQLYPLPDGGKIFQPLTDIEFGEKCHGFELHKSQLKPSPSPLGIDGIANQSRYYGLMCGAKYAELYYQLRYIRSI